MKASKENPIYSLYIVSGNTKYNVTAAMESLEFSDQEKQIAKRMDVTIMNVKVGNTWLSSLIKVRDRVYAYANDGERNEEVWRGYVWTRGYKSGSSDRTLQLRCYDNLIYFQESEHSAYFSSGKSTKDIMSTLCKEWGVKIEYTYQSITHTKLALRGNLADIFTADILDLVKERTGKKYVILSEKDVMQVKATGTNTTIYKIEGGKNAIETTSECTMDGMVTKVVVLGKADDNDRHPVEATLSGDTSKYGTLQKIINRSENTSLADAKKEAQSILKTDGKPKWEYEVTCSDIPWIRKGDKVVVNAGDMTGNYIVKSIDRSISNDKKEMTLTVEAP